MYFLIIERRLKKMKTKTLAAFLVLSLTAIIVLSSGVHATLANNVVTCPNSGIVGDANSDGTADIIDSVIIANIYVGNYYLNTTNIKCVDATGNNVVDIVDSQVIAQYYVGLDVSMYPVGTMYTL